MRAGIYVRVSTEDQAKEGYSISAQRERLTAYVQSQDWEIFDYYIDDGRSAKDTYRPDLQRMLADIREKKIDVVLVYKLDRLTRSVLDLYTLLDEFEKYDCKFKSASEVYDTTTAIGRLFITLVAALAQWERENLGERVRFGMEQMAREGKRPGGVIPFGYNPEFTLNEQESSLVREMFRKYAYENAGTSKLAQWLNKVHSSRNWGQRIIAYMLKNPIYCGDIRWDKDGNTIMIPDALPAIVTRETFEQAQRILDARNNMHPRRATSDYLFSGNIVCARCGFKMAGKRRENRKYYYCPNWMKGLCDCPHIREDEIEKRFLEYVRAWDFTEAAKEAATHAEPSDDEDRERLLRAELEKVHNLKKRWQYAWGEEMMTDDEYRQRMAEARGREGEIASKLSEFQATKSADTDSEKAGKLLAHFQANWDELGRNEKKAVIQTLGLSISVDKIGKIVTITDIQL